MNETVASRSLPDIPETDDPVVLRELLRQAHEHLRMRESIEQMLAENVARTERLLGEARAAHAAASAVDPAELRAAVDRARLSLRAALAAVDRLGTLVSVDAAPVTTEASTSTRTEREKDGPRTVEVLVQEVTSPAIARSLHQFLVGLDQVTRAEVRELAEGLLRITVETSAPITGETLAAWEPERD
ncbi:MAG: hypothetical protein M3173_06225, partial [Chloroflexota bacterium]|nr:hypothetical protein [Chloroflexota bacterium]